jgi:hypothetical protein
MDIQQVEDGSRMAARWRALADLPSLRDAPPEAFLSRKEVAALLGLAPYTLARMAARGMGPPCISFGERSHRYQVKLLKRYLEIKTQEELEHA